MAYPPLRPTPPKDFAARACDPLEHGDSNICVTAAKKTMDVSIRQQRSIEMASYPLDSLPSWLRHHAGEAWSIFSNRIGRGGVEFCPELDDPKEVCELLANMPESLLNRLEPCFLGLEREGDPKGFFRNWFLELSKKYRQDMLSADLISGSNDAERYQNRARAVGKSVPEFTEFFESLREFIGNEACMNSSWLQGDASCAAWDLAVFEKHIVWGNAAV